MHFSDRPEKKNKKYHVLNRKIYNKGAKDLIL